MSRSAATSRLVKAHCEVLSPLNSAARSRRSFCDGVSRISKRLALLVISVMP